MQPINATEEDVSETTSLLRPHQSYQSHDQTSEDLIATASPVSTCRKAITRIVDNMCATDKSRAGLYTAILQILGMTCNTCTTTIETSLRLNGIDSVSVSLESHTCSVRFNPSVITIEDIVEEIPSKFKVTVLDMKPDRVAGLAVQISDPAIFDAKFAITGMTCTSCSKSIEKITMEMEGVISSIVSVVTNSGTIRYDSNVVSHEDIVEEIESIGFEAEFISRESAWDQNTDESSFDLERNLERKCSFVVSNLYRSNVGEAVDVLQAHNNVIRVVPFVDVKEIEIVYSAPTTIRDLLWLLRGNQFDADTIDKVKVERERFLKQQERDLNHQKMRVFISLLFGVPAFVIAMILGELPGTRQFLMTRLYGNLTIMAILLMCLATPVQFGVGMFFFKAAYAAAKHGTSNMSTLVSIGTLSAYVYATIGVVLAIAAPNTPAGLASIENSHFFETSSTVITVVLLGKYFQNVAKVRTADAMNALIDMQSETAFLLTLDDRGNVEEEKELSIEMVEVGEIVKVHRGSKVPLDGTIVNGTSSVNEAALTGESMPRNVDVGDTVMAASVNISGVLYVRVDKTKSDSAISQIVRLMQHAQTTKPSQQELADKISAVFVPIVIIIALVTFCTWFILGITHQLPHSYMPRGDSLFLALMFGLSVIVIACPCALGLATPTAVMVGVGVGARYGLLIKGGSSLEVGYKVDTIVFDKTGTLTWGLPSVASFMPVREEEEESALIRLAAGAELDSEHPIAKALVSYAVRKEIELPHPDSFEAFPGQGIEAVVEGQEVIVGNLAMLSARNIDVDQDTRELMGEYASVAQTPLLVAVNGRLSAILSVFDSVRPHSIWVVRQLQDRGVEVKMLTGDNRAVAVEVAKQVGIRASNIIADVLPSEKHAVVRELQDDGHVVAMVGDGINDAAALAQSDLGISIGGGTHIAMESADMVIVRDDLRHIVTAIDLSQATTRRIYWNFAWGFLFNILGIPIAAGVFYPIWRVQLPPEVAAAAMACSSLMVLGSSLYLKSYRSPVSEKDNEMYEELAKKDEKKMTGRVGACGCQHCGCTTKQKFQMSPNDPARDLEETTHYKLVHQCVCEECGCAT